MCGGDAGEMLWVGKGVTVFLLDLGVGVCPATAGCHVVWCTLQKWKVNFSFSLISKLIAEGLCNIFNVLRTFEQLTV